MNEPKVQRRPVQRRIKYVDQKIQLSLMVSMIILELLLVVVALAYLDFKFNEIIEDSLYRIHPLPHVETVRMMLIVLAQAVGTLMIVNLIAMFAADRIWAIYIGSVLKLFRHIIYDVWDLNLRTMPSEASNHEVLDLAIRWHSVERQRCLDIRAKVTALDSDLSNPSAVESLRNALGEIRQRLD